MFLGRFQLNLNIQMNTVENNYKYSEFDGKYIYL